MSMSLSDMGGEELLRKYEDCGNGLAFAEALRAELARRLREWERGRAQIQTMRDALAKMLTFGEAVEDANLEGHEGCYWPVEEARCAIKEADSFLAALPSGEQTKGEREIPDYGDVMTLADFKECCETRLFIDSDGSGNYANPPSMSKEPAIPSEIEAGNIKPGYTHVVWFNK